MTDDKYLDLVSIGDLMLDFTCIGETKPGILAYERNPGGAPSNVASQLARLGGKAGLIATVGPDEHGEYLYRLAKEELKFDVTNLVFSQNVGTKIAFVYFKEGNDRYFTNYLSARADLDIRADRLNLDQLRHCKVLNYTPLSHERGYPIFETVKLVVKAAREAGALIAYDPNFRFPYEDPARKQLVVDAIEEANILKLTLEELDYFLGERDLMAATDKLLAGNARIIAVTMGAGGCFLRNKRAFTYQPTYDVDVMDTTGAGDSYMGSLIYAITREGVDIDSIGEEELIRIARFCNACSSASTMNRGSLLVMPDREKVSKIMGGVPLMTTTLQSVLECYDGK
ncbi:carbohydrate kinase [Anaerolentibacter hominis]|uniref:carbohydrate kinase family protein n=1 Tax=Anaerolentibacter hominis TaxID=3079009 RepID=UPI0031B7FF21